MPEHQIVLLPRERYWEYVDAAKAYAGRYGAQLTDDPDTAGRFMAPQQVVTVVDAPNAYPALGDIRAWFARHHPGVRLDLVSADSPQALREALAARVASAHRFQGPPGALALRWPTDYARINQGFGANPEYHRRFGWPGHEGVDVFAAQDAPVYACAAGTVSRVDRFAGDAARQPYGNSVRIDHAGGYQTTYAYLADVAVSQGQVVSTGQLIGRAGATGNTAVPQVHLSLRLQGATASGQTAFPNDVIDPTPHLVWPEEASVGDQARVYPWPYGYCLVGVHGRADGPLDPKDYPAFTTARVEAVKLLTSARPEDVDGLRSLNPRMFIMMRLFASFTGRVVPAEDFANWMRDEMGPFYQRGIRHFEIHNEPNLVDEGWTLSWRDGGAFGAWFIDVRNRLKAVYPNALFGYPGLSPGDHVVGVRANALDFLTASDPACRAADWVGLHSYWQNEHELATAIGGLGYLEYRRRFPEKLLFVTEFSNQSAAVDWAVKGQQYVRYYQHLRSLPGVGAAFAFVVSASTSFGTEVWRWENGALTPIPAVVGGRADAIGGPPP